jgi:DNA-binding response OmpR family regulator
VVLIADDEPSMRVLVQTTIENGGYTVLDAADGDQAWAMIQQHEPSVVLLDVEMPGMRGLDVLVAIRADERLSRTRVILLTAKSLTADILGGMTAGADSYVSKPFSPLELLTRVEEMVQSWRDDVGQFQGSEAAPSPMSRGRIGPGLEA